MSFAGYGDAHECILLPHHDASIPCICHCGRASAALRTYTEEREKGGYGARRCYDGVTHWHVTLRGDDVIHPDDPFPTCDAALSAANTLNRTASFTPDLATHTRECPNHRATPAKASPSDPDEITHLRSEITRLTTLTEEFSREVRQYQEKERR